MMKAFYSNVYRNRNVLITGHTGFKGSWLAFWLEQMEANLCGYALPPETHPNHFSLLGLNTHFSSISADIRDFETLNDCFQSFQPEIVFHLAAQALVRRSYREPLDTFAANVMGTANVLEASRQIPSLRAVVIVTSDKCYRNNEWEWGYKETDALGGHDPYSASKACAELVTAAFRASFFAGDTKNKQRPLIATVRAGNVIGGGDWAEDRLLPDIARAATRNETIIIRSPHAVRPWQHVMEPLSGYLLLGQQLLEGRSELADAWNFGPSDNDTLSVQEILDRLKFYWKGLNAAVESNIIQPHEAGMLNLDSSKTRRKLGWRPVWDCGQALEKTAMWYQRYYDQGLVSTAADILAFIETAKDKGLRWIQ